MPEELEEATSIKPMTGLLTDTTVLGFNDHVNVDLLTPDYSILDLVEYEYPMSEHYLVFRRGLVPIAAYALGMKQSTLGSVYSRFMV